MFLLDVPHFGRGLNITHCIIFLLSLLRVGCLWLDKVYPLDMELMHKVSSLLHLGENVVEVIVAQYLKAEEAYHKYGTHLRIRGVVIFLISIPEIYLVT